MTIPTPELDFTLARCPACGCEEVKLVSELNGAKDVAAFTLQCQQCWASSPAGWASVAYLNLLCWVLQQWGVRQPEHFA